MTMQAIRVSPDTLDLIFSQNKSIVEFDKESLLRWIADGQPYYFVPQWDESSSDYTGWALMPATALENFDFDAEKAQTEFVTFTRKAA